MSYLPLLEVTSDIVPWPRSVLTHLDLDNDQTPAEGQPGHSPLIGKIASNGNISVVAKVNVFTKLTNQNQIIIQLTNHRAAILM